MRRMCEGGVARIAVSGLGGRCQYSQCTAKAGCLSPDEEIEIENYERVGHHLGILQSKARLALRSLDSPDT